MKSYILAFILITLLSCNNNKNLIYIDKKYITKFDENKTERKQNRINYLQLTGLFKIDSLSNSFGKDSINNFTLAIDNLAPTIGTITKKNNVLEFRSEKDVIVKTIENDTVTYLILNLDKYGSSIKLFYKQLNWQVITRSGQHYLRVWNTKNPAIKAFKGFEQFKLNPEFILEGQFTYYQDHKTDYVHSQLGVNASTNFIGKVTFKYKENNYDLDVGEEGFTMVSDETTGNETYGGGRYIYLDLPKTDGLITLDFNYLYNPPCTFSKFTTCLYPPRQNNLPFKIFAGETIVQLKE